MMDYKPGIHRLSRSDYDKLRAENERLRTLTVGMVTAMLAAIGEHDVPLASQRRREIQRMWDAAIDVQARQGKADDFPTESQRRMLDAAPGPRWPADQGKGIGSS